MTHKPPVPPAGEEGLVLDLMTIADIDDVLVIEQASFSDAWPRKAFEQECTNAFARPIVVRDASKHVIAYLLFWVAGPEYHLVNIAVHPNARGRGIGRWLIELLIFLAKDEHRELISLEVRPTNTVARGMYERHGFEVQARRRDYYRDGEDALIMVRTLIAQSTD